MSDERFDDLETRIAWQESALEDLNQVVLDQARQIELLELAIKRLHQRMEAMTQSGGANPDGHELPPHY